MMNWAPWGSKPAPAASPAAAQKTAGGSLFSGLVEVKASEAAPKQSAFGFISASSSSAASSPKGESAQQTPPTEQVSSGNGSMSSQPKQSAQPATSSAFGFLNAESAQQSGSSQSNSSFSFITGSSNTSTPEVEAPQPKPALSSNFTAATGDTSSHKVEAPKGKSAFTFLDPNSVEKPALKPATSPPLSEAKTNAVSETQQRNLVSRHSSDTVLAASPSAFTSNQTIKKKKSTSKRPGYARDEEDSQIASYITEPQHKKHDQPSTAISEPPTSILAGLTVYVEDDNHGYAAPEPIEKENLVTQSAAPAEGVSALANKYPEQISQSMRRDSTETPTPTMTTSPSVTTEAHTEVATDNTPVHADKIATPEVEEALEEPQSASGLEVKAEAFAQSLKKLDKQFQEFSTKELTMHQEKLNLNDEISTLVEEQEKAIEEEDFEKAEKLQLKIDENRRKLLRIDQDISQLNKDRLVLEEKREELFCSQLLEIEHLVDDAETDERVLVSRAAQYTKQCELEQASILRKLEEREGLINSQLDNAEAEVTLMEEERDRIKERILSSTSEIRSEQSEWREKVEVVDQEIAELERALEDKRAERSQYMERLDEIEERITAAEGKHVSRLNDAEKRVSESLAHLNSVKSDQEELIRSQAEFEEKVASHDKTLNSLNTQARMAKDRFRVLNRLLAIMKQESSSRRKRAANAQREAKQIQSMQDELVWKKSRIELLEKDLVAIETQATEDSRFLSESAKELVELENQKLVFVSMRNFKEAGRVAADIKAIQTKRQEATERLDSSTANLEEKKASLSAINEEVARDSNNLDAVLKKSENEKLRNLLQAERALEQAIHELEAESTSESQEETSNESLEVPDDGQSDTTKAKTEPSARVDRSIVLPLLIMLQAELDLVKERISFFENILGMEVDRSDQVLESEESETDRHGPSSTQVEDVAGSEIEEHVPIEELERQLNEAIEKEDFELADQLYTRIERAKQQESNVSASSKVGDSETPESDEASQPDAALAVESVDEDADVPEDSASIDVNNEVDEASDITQEEVAVDTNNAVQEEVDQANIDGEFRVPNKAECEDNATEDHEYGELSEELSQADDREQEELLEDTDNFVHENQAEVEDIIADAEHNDDSITEYADNNGDDNDIQAATHMGEVDQETAPMTEVDQPENHATLDTGEDDLMEEHIAEGGESHSLHSSRHDDKE